MLVALIGPFAGLPDPARTHLGARLLPPLSDGHLLGTDHLGRDLVARLVEALRTVLASRPRRPCCPRRSAASSA